MSGNARYGLAQAYATLGRPAEARSLIIDHVTSDASIAGWSISVLSHIDVNEAAERALATKAAHPNWLGLDAVAAEYLFNVRLLAHPKIEAYFVKEGKWIDYLAERVPEYAKYKTVTP